MGKLNLYQKLLEIQKKIIWLKKDTDWNNYKYVSWSKVLEYIKPMMNEHWIILKQEIIDIENTRQDYTTGQWENIKQKNEILSKVSMRFTWIDCESWEKDESLFWANWQNWRDKWVWSALTYWERYFLLKYFHIDTDEDDIDAKKKVEFTETMFEKFKKEFESKYKSKHPTPDSMLDMLDKNYTVPYPIIKMFVSFYNSL